MKIFIYRVIIILSGILTFLPNKYLVAKTATELIYDTRLYARDPSSTGRVRFTDSQILNFLNEAQKNVIAMTLCIQKVYTFNTIAGTIYYEMPSDYIYPERVLSNNMKLEEKSPAKLDIASSKWETVSGKPINYFVNFSSRTKIGFYPFPNTVNDTTTIRVEYYAQATDMIYSDTPFNAITELIPFHQMLAYYSAAQMLYIDGNINAADRYMTWFFNDRNAMQQYCRARPGYLPNVNVKSTE